MGYWIELLANKAEVEPGHQPRLAGGCSRP